VTILGLDDAAKLSHELRHGRSAMLARRRGVVRLSLAASGIMGFITLYQMGIIRHLPEPPLPRLAADEVDASPTAYRWLATPDAALGLASYAGTVVLAAMGCEDRAERQPLIPLVLAAKLGLDAAIAGLLTVEQWRSHRAFCSWCLLAAGLTFASLPLIAPETRAAWRTLAGRSAGR
jgi:uncharacterized membrane protein